MTVINSNNYDPLSNKLRKFSDGACSGHIVGVYLTTNECGLVEVKRRLTEKPQVAGSCHIGFSGMHNFDIMAIRRSAWGLICDFNPDNKVFIEKTVQILRDSQSRAEFVKEMTKAATAKNHIQFSVNVNNPSFPEEEIRGELTREGSWLANDESFSYIRGLALQDRIASINLDIRDTATCKKIAAVFQDNAIQLDTLYLSNICNYMAKEGEKKAFALSVHALMKPETDVINCPEDPDIWKNDYTPKQRVMKGCAFQSPEDDVHLFQYWEGMDNSFEFQIRIEGTKKELSLQTNLLSRFAHLVQLAFSFN